MKLTIDREVWARGNGPSQLLFDSAVRLQCCVGIYCTTLGVEDDYLRSESCVDDIWRIANMPELSWLVAQRPTGLWGMSDEAEQLYNINDSQKLSESEREAEVVRRFAAHDVEVEFVN